MYVFITKQKTLHLLRKSVLGLQTKFVRFTQKPPCEIIVIKSLTSSTHITYQSKQQCVFYYKKLCKRCFRCKKYALKKAYIFNVVWYNFIASKSKKIYKFVCLYCFCLQSKYNQIWINTESGINLRYNPLTNFFVSKFQIL